MTEETKKYWEMASKGYQEGCNIPIKIHYGPGAPFEEELKLLGDLRDKKILEIGCGGAQCGIAMAKQGAKVIGIDISERQLEFARALAREHDVVIRFYQGDIESFPQVRSNSQDLVFTAWALLYVDNLENCFREVHRVLKRKGHFVASLIHPLFRIVDENTLRLKESYFNVGRQSYLEIWDDGTKHNSVVYNRTLSELINSLVDTGLSIERMIEPNSRVPYKENPWHNKLGCAPELMNYAPPTVIFKSRKLF